MKRPLFALAALSLLGAAPHAPPPGNTEARPVAAAQPQQQQSSVPDRVAIQQIVGIAPKLTLFADVADANGKAVDISKDTVTINGTEPVTVQSVRHLGQEDGTAYIVLLDTSASISSQTLEIRAALQRWIRDMSSNDRMAILTFGDKVVVRQDFTGDAQQLLAASNIEPADKRTHLFEGFKRAAEFARRRDADLPLRRVIVVVSDGINDENETGLTADDAVREVQSAGVPVFALDSATRFTPGEAQCSLVLGRVSTNSSGLCERLAGRAIDQTFAAINARIQRVLVIDAECDACLVDGGARPYSLQVKIGSKVLRSAERNFAFDPTLQPAPDRKWLYWAIGAAVLIALLVLILLLRRKPKPADPVELSLDPTPGPIERRPATPTPAVPPAAAMATVSFVVMEGPDKSKTYSAPIRDRLIMGRGADCNITVTGDDGVAERQCELQWTERGIQITNLAPDSPMVVGGGWLQTPRRLKNRETLRMGSTNLRFKLGERES